MNVLEAIGAARGGQHISRAGWSKGIALGGSRWVAHLSPKLLGVTGEVANGPLRLPAFVSVETSPGRMAVWTLYEFSDITDIEADDWMVGPVFGG